MTEFPWSKFFWSDWESDESLKQCSLAAQGLWMRMLCICATGDPIGYLTIAGNPLDSSGVARMAGVSMGEAENLMEELSRWGVFSRDRRGRIYSRRIVRDANKSAKARKNGKRGGNPTLGKQREKSCSVNPEVNQGDKPQRPEARVQKEREEARKRAPPPSFDADLGIRPEVASGFISHRKALRKPLTARAVQLLCNELRRIRESGRDPNDALDLAIERGWQSAKLDWIVNAERSPPSRGNTPPANGAGATDRMLRRYGVG